MQIKNITILSIIGRIDESSGKELDEQLRHQVSTGNVNLIMDFKNVEFINSEALRVILGSVKHARSNGGDIFIAMISPMINNILKTTGFSSLLKIYFDIDSALMGF